jgi:hypothetical protein
MRGSTIYSYDSHRHTCPVTGSVWGSQGRAFDDVDDKISSTFAVTISTTVFWWKPSATIDTGSAAKGILSWAFTTDSNLYVGASTGALLNETMTLQQGAGSGRCGIINQTFTADNWYCIAWVWNGSAHIPYVNGVAVTTDTAGVPSQITVERLVISDSDDGAVKLAQTFGEVLLSSLAWSPGDISSYYNKTKWRHQ